MPRGAFVAAVGSGAMIAQQVAGKAARDALFLSSFSVEHLPVMMAASAVVSLLAVLWISKAMVRHSPAKVVPVAFAVSSAALLVEWGVSFVAPRVTAIGLYLHMALFGAIVISAFWSLINETFALHAGRRAITWIAGGGTVGGVLGGLAAWRAAGLIPLLSMLPLLAVTNLACVGATWRLQRAHAAESEDEVVTSSTPGLAQAKDVRSAFHLLMRVKYLRNLGVVVALGAVISGLLDYVFSAAAVAHYTGGPELLAFFGKFWLVIGLLSFLLETLFGRIILEKLGLAVTLAILPGIVVVCGAFGIAVPGLLSMMVLRGGEAIQRNSLFRAAYELLYAPLSPHAKRSTKTLIDVGFDRVGTVLAAVIAMVCVTLYQAPRAEMLLVAIAMACALLSATRSIPIHRGYVALLEGGLRKMSSAVTSTEAEVEEQVELRDEIVDQLERTADVAAGDELASGNAVLRAALDLGSGVPTRAKAILAREEPLTAPLVAFTVLLLADKELRPDAIEALVKAAPTCTGQLVDALCDPRIDFHVRRRIPLVLARCPTNAAAYGLLRGIQDERFEVRHACGRALLQVSMANPEVAIPLDRIVEIVTTELRREELGWDTALDADDEYAAASLVGRLRHDRLDRRVEHVFNVLALHLDPESLRTAFKALHDEDEALRGTALEYLETVLPNEVRDIVWPFLGEARPMRPARSAEEILADLRKS